MTVGPHDPAELVLHALARALDDPARRAVVLDLRHLTAAGAAAALDAVTGWITCQPVRTITTEQLVAATATRVLQGEPS